MPKIRAQAEEKHELGPAAETQTAARPAAKPKRKRKPAGKPSPAARAVAAAAAKLDPCPFLLAMAVYLLACAVVIGTAIGLANAAKPRPARLNLPPPAAAR